MVKLALPLIASQLGLIAMSVTDVLMIAPLGPTHLAAGSLAFMLYFNIWLFCLGVLIATASLASQARGARNFKGVRRSVRQGFWVALTLVPLAALAHWFGGDFLLLAGKTRKWWPWPSPICMPSSAVFPSASASRAALFRVRAGAPDDRHDRADRRGAGERAAGLCIDPWRARRAGFRIAGAAWATSLVWVGIFAWLVLVVLRDRSSGAIMSSPVSGAPDWLRYREIWRIGLPIGVALVAETGLFAVAQLMMGWIGTLELAAHAVAIQVASVAFMVPLGIGQAAQVRVGQRFGAGDRAGVHRAGWMALILAGLTTGLAALALWFAPEAIVGLFLDADSPVDAPVFALAVSFLLVAAVFQLVDGAQVAMISSLRGLSDTAGP